MNRREMLKTGLAGLALGLASTPFTWAAPTPGARKRHLLVFTRSQGYQHSVVTRKNGELSDAEQIVTELGEKNGFAVTCTKDGGIFEPDKIGQFDAFLFETTGDLTKELSKEAQEKEKRVEPPMSAEGKKALLQAIADGKGFVGCHCASDTFHSPGAKDKTQPADESDPYIVMLGGEFIIHGAQQKAGMRVTDDQFPGAKGLKDFELMEEWYALKNFAPDLHVILVQDTKGMKGPMYQRPNYPATWARMHHKGRVFFTSMGHREDVWKNATFQELLTGALSWAFGDAKADVSPNIDKVTPKANELPG